MKQTPAWMSPFDSLVARGRQTTAHWRFLSI